jgi:Xaa-Pro aminopeptidase
MDFESRQTALRNSLEKNRLDCLLVSHLPNIRYLSGFTGSAGVLLVTDSQAIFFTDGRYTQQAREEVQGAKIVISRKAALAGAAEWLRSRPTRKKQRLGIEGEYLTVAAQERLRAILSGYFQLKLVASLVERMRMVKGREEIERIREAVILGDKLFHRALKVIRPGVTETSVAAEMEYAARRAGAEAMSFSTIIASGARSSLPHGQASQARIAANGFVVCDFGVILGGYCSDETRTVHVGRPSSEAKSAYEAVTEAQYTALDAVAPGKPVAEIDRAARQVLRKAKLARYFTHSTGHGVGLEIHEAPRIAAGQNDVLRPGMVITIEPGVYIPGVLGVRIEDMVVVTKNGCEILTPTRKELIIC